MSDFGTINILQSLTSYLYIHQYQNQYIPICTNCKKSLSTIDNTIDNLPITSHHDYIIHQSKDIIHHCPPMKTGKQDDSSPLTSGIVSQSLHEFLENFNSKRVTSHSANQNQLPRPSTNQASKQQSPKQVGSIRSLPLPLPPFGYSCDKP